MCESEIDYIQILFFCFLKKSMQLFLPEWAAWEGREILTKCHMASSLQECYKIGNRVVSAYADNWDYINEYKLFHFWSCSCWTAHASKRTQENTLILTPAQGWVGKKGCCKTEQRDAALAFTGNQSSASFKPLAKPAGS